MKKYRVVINYDTSGYDVEMVQNKKIFTMAECHTEEEANKILNYYKEKIK